MWNRIHTILITSITGFTAFAAMKYWTIRFSSDQDVLMNALLYSLVILLPNFVCLVALFLIISKDARKFYYLVAIYCIVIFNTFAYAGTAIRGEYVNNGNMAIGHIMNPLAVYMMSFFLLPVALGMTLEFPGNKKVNAKEDSP